MLQSRAAGSQSGRLIGTPKSDPSASLDRAARLRAPALAPITPARSRAPGRHAGGHAFGIDGKRSDHNEYDHEYQWHRQQPAAVCFQRLSRGHLARRTQGARFIRMVFAPRR
ncbi:hypothetical protein FJ567_23060 [Mesorhizobium sp. B2-4-16]|nr:hypothetical protein FJ567_23060 [Mesorhizobium sp. B2-4-16]TPL61031.1 hypothetical protein FJ956_26310 [Mesorhizobium sp. B2-4-3]